MSLIHAIRRFAPSTITADGTGANPVDADRDGNLFTGPDYIQRSIARGLGGRATVGALSAGITGGGAGTVIDLDQPEVSISVADGYVMQINEIRVQCHVPLLATDADECEILVALDRSAANAGDGTATAETVYNMRTDLGASGPAGLTIKSAYTADTTDPVLNIELARKVITGDVQGTAANGMFNTLDLVYAPQHPDYIVGPACVYVYWGGTVAVPGFAQVSVVVRPETSVV
jgi:hypothetical protein